MTRLLEPVQTPPPPLRPYQGEALDGLRRGLRDGHKRQLLVMPTGAGKTRTAAELVKRAAERGNQTLWLADRLELVEQASGAFDRLGLGHGLIMPGHRPHEEELVLCGTVQSMAARMAAGQFNPRHVSVIVLDEAHRAPTSKQYLSLLSEYPHATVIGLTATPVGPVADVFSRMVQPVTTRELMDAGHLVRPRYFIPSEIDLVRAKGQDFTQAQLDEYAARHPRLIGDIVETFTRISPVRRACVFPCNIRHSVAIRNAFHAVGIPAVHIDGTMERGERQMLMQAFRDGEYQVLTSVNIAIEGLDVPDVSSIVIARPTQSERIYIQAVGRGLRTFPGKTDCTVQDHAGAYLRLGPAEDYEHWPLTPQPHKPASKSRPGEPREPRDVTCEQCQAVFHASRTCPECGHVHTHERAPRDIEMADGELLEATRDGRKKAEYTDTDKERWYGELLWYCESKGKKPGQAFFLFGEKFSEKPGNWQRTVTPQPPGAEVLGWIRSRNIRFAKRREKANAAD